MNAAMSLEIFKHLVSPKIAFSARDTNWVSIEKLFLDNVTSRYMHLKSDFNEASRAHDSMSDYLRYVKSIDSLQANECSLSEEDIITQILHGFLEAYSDVVTVYICPFYLFISNSTFQITDLHVKIFNLFYPLKLLKPCILCVFLTSWFMNIIFQFIFCLFFMFYFICADSKLKSINESFSSNLDP